MTKTYNTPKYEGYEEAMEYFKSLDEKEQLASEENNVTIFTDDKPIHRRRRKNARKAKKHQIELADSVKRKRKSKYRWNPVWHKMKLSDLSPKKIKNRCNNVSTIDALKEYNVSNL